MTLCRVCWKTKPLNQFYPRQVRVNGQVGECKVCTRARVAANRKRRREYYRAYDADRYQSDPKVKDRHRRYQKTAAGKRSMELARERWAKSNPEKRHAHIALNNAVRGGRITKSDVCESCGARAGRIEGHHFDYKSPLIVTWLCRQCHSDIHKMDAE